ncbi:MAG: AAA family ATPase [Rickettsiales bacterium]
MVQKKTKKISKPLLKNLTIKNFRCFENFHLKDLKRVNIFVGDNNSGKSSVLEAVGMLYPTVRNYMGIIQSRESIAYRDSDMIGIRTGRFAFSKLEYLFYKKKDNLNKIQISSELNDSKIDVSMSISKEEIFSNRDAIRRYGIEDRALFKEDYKTFIVDYNYKKISAQIGFSNMGTGKLSIENFEEYDIELLFDNIPSTKEVASKWNRIVEMGLKSEEKYIKLSQKFDPKIITIRFVGDDLLFFKSEGYDTNFSNMGNGFKKFFDILITAEIMGKRLDKFKILCIDEIDNGLYHDKQDLFWEQIIKLCEEYNIQLFTTTHSYDCLKNISKIALKDEYEDLFQIVRLEKFDDKILQTTISQEELETMIDNHYEIR